MKIKASAKINLALDVLGKDLSGYHFIQTVYHEIEDLFDEVEILESEEDVADEELSLKALKLIKSEFNIKKSAKIRIQKNIPRGSGLGGASSCAAAVIKGLNEFWKLNLKPLEMQKLAAKIGMDVPFFILGGTAYGSHFGEIIVPLKKITYLKFKVFPKGTKEQNKTQKAYESLDLKLCGRDLKKTELLLEAIEKEDKEAIIENMHNDFETIYPLSSSPLKKGLRLCGSGPSTFSPLV